MRLFMLLCVFLSALLVCGGGWLIVETDALVRTPAVRQIGDRLRWSGVHAMGPDGCSFHPNLEQWQANLTTIGWALVATGAGLCAASYWRLAKKVPRQAPEAEQGPARACFTQY